MAGEPVTSWCASVLLSRRLVFRFKEKFDVSSVHCECGVDDRQRDVYRRIDGARRKTASFEKKR
jgi:hypothetical protein